jgi:hypothetical protein
LLYRIRNKLTEGENDGLPVPDIVKERLETHVQNIVRTLPEDLQLVISRKS